MAAANKAQVPAEAAAGGGAMGHCRCCLGCLKCTRGGERSLFLKFPPFAGQPKRRIKSCFLCKGRDRKEDPRVTRFQYSFAFVKVVSEYINEVLTALHVDGQNHEHSIPVFFLTTHIVYVTQIHIL